MENLSNDLLVEIFSRVPYKIAVRCKSISKRFLALISHLQFIERSILHHQHRKKEEWHLNFISKRKLLISFFPHLLHLDQFSLSFLGRKFNPELDNVTSKKKHVLYSRIVGFSNGLLLCKKTARGRVYHVCNPITKQWIKLPLPPPPLTGHNQRDRVHEAFVCEPYYQVVEENDNRRITFNPHRFRAVRFPRFEGTIHEILSGITKSKFKMVVFSSETGEWSKKLVSCPTGFTQATILQPVVAHQGKLYFMGNTSLLVYDPFNNDEQYECDIINYPIGSSANDILFNGHVGVCCGNIRISSVYLYSDILGVTVKVWELEQDCSTWRLLHVARVPHQHVRDCIVPEMLKEGEGEILDMGLQVRAFHPYHGDVVFFQRAHTIFVANFKSNQFDTVGYGIHGFQSLQIFSLDLPWWPTPIPSVI